MHAMLLGWVGTNPIVAEQSSMADWQCRPWERLKLRRASSDLAFWVDDKIDRGKG